MPRYNIVDGQRVQFTEQQEVEWNALEQQAPAQLLALQSEQGREERDKLLSTSDWTQVADSPVDKSAWATYRQLLRDVPSQAEFPNTIVWPTKPV